MANDSATRGLRDEATVGPDPTRARDLKRLSDLRYEVAAGEPDVRGWTVYASTGREVGTVADLLVDTEAGEVVMLDVDLRRSDQHTLAPIRAAWIDHRTRRVVLDARALASTAEGTSEAGAPPAGDVGTAAAPVPVLPRSGPLTEVDIQQFDTDYQRAYGERAADSDASWRVARGTDDALRFGPRRLLDPAAGAPPAGAPAATPTTAAASAAPTLAPEGSGAFERRTNRIDDASTLDDGAGIDPRELDARVRIEEGATVDDAAPVAGVRYEGQEQTPHNYGRPDEAYGPGYGSGRIGFNKVVSREPYAPTEGDASDDGARTVRYRQYGDRYAGPEASR